MPHAIRPSADALPRRTAARACLAALTMAATALGVLETRHCHGADEGRPPVSARVEALLLWRDSPAARPLYIDRGADAGVALDAGEIGTGMAAGPRYRVDWSANGTDAIEFNYFNVQSFGGARGAVSPQGALDQANILGFQFPDVTSALATSSAGIKSFEANRRRSLDWCDGDFLYGFRWVEWNERLAIRDTTLTGTESGADFFSTDTLDNLYGAQIGLDLVLAGSRNGRAWLEGIGKAGIYYDRAVQHSFVNSVSTDQIIRGNAASADTTSFVGELGFTGCVRLSEHWVARTGFTMFWLGNVSAAADQLSANNLFSQEIVSRIDTGADVFLYGINLGLEASW